MDKSSLIKAEKNHTEAHFSRENNMMQEYGFPPYAVHAQEHSSALEGLKEIQRQWNDDQNVEQLAPVVSDAREQHG
ncbi:hypothetical protein [Thiolapillus sp.]|uniref:hypothetical protein n=1 Tax=Thiolapillus sp. TaxID=2017437 RepID=UPI003AF993A9